MRMNMMTFKGCCVLAVAMAGCSSGGTDKAANEPVLPGGQDPTVGPAVSGPAAGTPGTSPPPTAAGTGGDGAATDAGGTAAPTTPDMIADLRGTGVCADLHTNYPGDKNCLPPPPEGEGMQIHIGPKSYTDMAVLAPWLVKPGQEDSRCVNFHTPNGEKIYYQSSVLSGRDGTHHIINTMYKTELTDGVYQACRDGGTGTNPDSLGNLPGAAKAYMPRAPIAPENAEFGRSVPPKVPAQADMHYFNFGDKDVMREFWLNIYFVPAEKIKQEASQIRAMGGLSWSAIPIPISTTSKVYPYTCPITADGRVIGLLGHYHSHGKRFTAWVKHAGGQRDKVYESYDYAEAQTFPYDTITTNPMFSATAAGATSGMLMVKAGDSLDWECEILNDDQPAGLRYTNEVKTGEMCNLWGESIGPLINCVVP